VFFASYRKEEGVRFPIGLGLGCKKDDPSLARTRLQIFYTPPFGNDPRLMVCRVNENNIKHRFFIIFYIYYVLTVFIIRLI
jgi:hypothetical protein